MEALSVKHFKLASGEGYKLLVNKSTGFPLYYPSLYITSQRRGNGMALGTIHSAINALKIMYGWQHHFNIDIEERFANKKLLRQNEIISLRDFCKRGVRTVKAEKVLKLSAKNVGRRAEISSHPSVGSPVEYNRLSEISEYFNFIANYLYTGKDPAHTDAIATMCATIKAHRPKKKSRSGQLNEEKSLHSDLVDEVLEIMEPGHENNPFSDETVQQRNYLMIQLLKYLGMRRGELLNIQTTDIDLSANCLNIVRRPDSPHDERRYPPNVKTLERPLQINDLLAKAINDYVLNIRNKFKAARKHPYLFVTHKAGPTQGKPLSNSAFGKLMSTLQRHADELSEVHAHAFRHTWNYEFSETCDADGSMSEALQDKIRSQNMGWKPTSGTAATYNVRYTKEKAKEALLAHQDRLMKRTVK